MDSVFVAASADFARLKQRILGREALIGIVGLGYVGQPLALAAAAQGFQVVGFDVDPERVALLNRGQSCLRTIGAERIAGMVNSGKFSATADMAELSRPDVILICVPTPLNKYREPDLSYIRATAADIAANLRAGQLICLESTTYPGTTVEVLKPLLEGSGLKVGTDVFLAFSPEREDPGNQDYGVSDIPKVVGADDAGSRELAEVFYGFVARSVVPVRSAATAEAVKLTENIFRCVNIALVNELKHIYAEMGVDVWEVIDAAKTKPFGFMPFYPGPGLGGHCIPIDPFYLSWKAREYEIPARFIELAGEINTDEPRKVVRAVGGALSDRKSKSLNGARVLMLGLAYKKNVDDMRESPALHILRDLELAGARVDFHDPWIPVIPETREFPELTGRRGVAWSPAEMARTHDIALIVTDHDGVDYNALVEAFDVVVDTRNATRDTARRAERVVQA